MNKKLAILGAIIGIVSMAMAWYFYDWWLALIILLALWGNNMERSSKKDKPITETPSEYKTHDENTEIDCSTIIDSNCVYHDNKKLYNIIEEFITKRDKTL